MSNPLEEEQNPLTYTPSALVNPFGEYFAVDEVDPDQAVPGAGDPGVGFGSSAQSLLTSGLYNGDFQNGPAEGEDSIISDANPLPYWRYANVQGAIKARWIADAAAPAGYSIEWSVTDGANDDEAYLEQIVPVTPRTGVYVPQIVVGAASPSSIFVFTSLDVQPLTVTGATTGTAVSTTRAFESSAYVHYRLLPIPSDARYVRVRVGVVIVTGGSGTTTLREIAIIPRLVYATLLGSDVTMPATGTRHCYLVSANAQGTPGIGASLFPAPYRGWVQSISVRASANVAGANIEYQVYDAGLVQAIGPKATIETGSDSAYATGTFNASTNYFVEDRHLAGVPPGGGKAVSQLRFRANVPSGTLTSTALDVVVTAVLGMAVINEL